MNWGVSKMTRSSLAIMLIGGFFACFLSSCDAGGPDATLRYRMTVEVETPEGLRKGSTVRELRFTEAGNHPSTGESRAQIDIVGEALAVDLPNGRTLFALLTGADGDVDYAKRIADRSGIWSEGKSLTIGPVVELWPTAPTAPKLAHTSPLPMFVTFRDVTDPTSVFEVEPSKLVATFGTGYRLKSVTVQVTDQPVTRGIRQRLIWLGDYPEPSLDPDHAPNDWSIAATTHHGDFSRGVQ
jgi:hypothetical protein